MGRRADHMEEPPYSVNGRIVDKEELLKDYPEPEDYEILFGDDDLAAAVEENRRNGDTDGERSSNESEEERSAEGSPRVSPRRGSVRMPDRVQIRSPTIAKRSKTSKSGDNKVWSSAGKYSMKLTPKGVDYRGLPMIEYLGRICPDYDRIDERTNESLRIQMMTKLGRWRMNQPKAGIASDDVLASMSMFTLDTYYHETDQTIEALNYGPLYRKTMVGVSLTLEQVAMRFGFKMAEDFTASQVEMLPVLDMITTNYAMMNGAGPLKGANPSTQIGTFAAVAFMVYMGIGYFTENTETRASLYKMISGSVSEQAVDAFKVGRPPSDSDPVQSPFAEKAESKPSSGVLGMVQKFAKYAPMLGAMAGTKKEAQTAATPTKQKRSGARHRAHYDQ